jgi:hypothetical protein
MTIEQIEAAIDAARKDEFAAKVELDRCTRPDEEKAYTKAYDRAVGRVVALEDKLEATHATISYGPPVDFRLTPGKVHALHRASGGDMGPWFSSFARLLAAYGWTEAEFAAKYGEDELRRVRRDAFYGVERSSDGRQRHLSRFLAEARRTSMPPLW